MEQQNKVITTKELFGQESIRQKFVDMLGKKAQGFITSVLQCVAANELLKNADPNSIYNAAAVAATLDLPLNNQLGFAYIVPYNISVNAGTKTEPRWETRTVAQFQIGYKGYIQLGQRTGQYKAIAATKILEGELLSNDPLSGPEFDFSKRTQAESTAKPIIGYASYFKLVNGFEKVLYMPIETLREHGRKFSKSYDTKKGLWQTDPETMCLKTVLKLNLSKFGPMSIELQTAYTTDQALIRDANTLDVDYLDSAAKETDKAHERITLLIAQAKTLEDLAPLREHADMDQQMEIARKEIDIRKAWIAQANGTALLETAPGQATLNAHYERIAALEELTK